MPLQIYTKLHSCLLKFSKNFLRRGSPSPLPRSLPRLFSGFALGSSFALNSRTLRSLDSGFVLRFWTPVSKILDPPLFKIHENWLQGWYSCERMKFQEFSRNSKSLKLKISGRYGIKTIHYGMTLFFLTLLQPSYFDQRLQPGGGGLLQPPGF